MRTKKRMIAQRDRKGKRKKSTTNGKNGKKRKKHEMSFLVLVRRGFFFFSLDRNVCVCGKGEREEKQ